MNHNHFLLYPKNSLGHVIIFIGEKPGVNEIQINRKPGFFDAVQLTEQQSHLAMNSPYQFIQLARSYHFYDPHLSKTIKFVFNGRSLQLLDMSNDLSKESVCNVFKHFLVKKGKRVLFLAESPKEKIRLRHKDPIRIKSEEKSCN